MLDVKCGVNNRNVSRSADGDNAAYVHGAVPPEIGGSMFDYTSSVSNAGISVLASLTFYFVAPRLGNALGVLSVIPYAAVATLMIPFMTLYKPAKKSSHTPRDKNVL